MCIRDRPSGLERGPPANCSAASYVARTTTPPVSNLSTLSPVSHDAHLLESIESSIPVRAAGGTNIPSGKAPRRRAESGFRRPQSQIPRSQAHSPRASSIVSSAAGSASSRSSPIGTPLRIDRPYFPFLSRCSARSSACLLYASDAADDLTRVDLGGRRILKK